MAKSDVQKPAMKSVWAIPSIIDGLEKCHESWVMYVPECEPFWAVVSTYGHHRRVPTACRGVILACETGKPSIVFVPNRQLAAALDVAKNIEVPFPLILVVEDHPILAPQLPPREMATRANVCIIEPCDASEVEYCANAAAKLSSASMKPVVIVTHHSLLGGSSSVEDTPEQVQQQSRQSSETISPLRLGRRLELNRQRTLPSPGEKVSVGFVTIGLSDPALKYLVSELQLLGRVPMLNLRLIYPIDVVPVERLLSRCSHVVVLEPRSGEVEREIIGISQAMQREGRDVAAIWGRELPPTDPELPSVKVPVDMLHPSVVARMTQHLLDDVKPSVNVRDQLLPSGEALDVPSSRRMTFGTDAAISFLRETVIRVLCAESSITNFVIDGVPHYQNEAISVLVETWGEEHFVADGMNVVRDAATQNETRLLLVWRSEKIGKALSTMAESVIPPKSDEHRSVVEVTLDNGEDFDAAIVSASQRKGVSVIVVSDGEEPRFDIAQLAEGASQIDRLGFSPQQAIVIPVEQLASVRMVPIDPWRPRSGSITMPLETTVTSKWLKVGSRKMHFSLQPIMERVVVTRTKPPVRVVAKSSHRVSPPSPIHASAPKWRVHIAGSRGDQPGVVGKVLMEAGSIMGYSVRAQCNNAYVGAGRRAWTQILFSRRQATSVHRPLVGSIPWGEADVLLGWDREEVLRAIDPKGALQVASMQRTSVIINTDALEHQSPLLDKRGKPTTLNLRTITPSCKTEEAVLRDFTSLARYRFHNERLGDLVQLGMAFQLGFIPVTVDAINSALSIVEKGGFARSIEAFEFGRQIALEPDEIWKPAKEDFQVDIDRLTRRCVRDLRTQGRRGSVHAGAIKRLIRQSRQAMPGLCESAEGRQSMIDFVNGIRRCMLWGGEDVASKYVGLICQLYTIDSPESGRSLTRETILPLAESMIIRDPIYLARLAMSPEVKRRIRNRLNVRNSRGDTLKRRFLTRFRVRIMKWSLRIDFRTSAWSPVLVTSLGKYVPRHWRGSRKDKAIREFVIHAVRSAISSKDHEKWVVRFTELNQKVLTGSMQKLSFEEIKKILQS